MYTTITLPNTAGTTTTTDDAALIQNAITALPAVGGFDVYVTTANNRAINLARVIIIGQRPTTPGGSTMVNSAGRRVIFHFDPGCKLVQYAGQEPWFRFNAPCIIGGNVVAPGFANKSDTCPSSFQVGGGALSNREPGISGYDTTAEQANKHERGRCASYFQASISGPIEVPGAHPTTPATKATYGVNHVLVPAYYTGYAASTSPAYPAFVGIEPDLIRIGTYIDLPGRTIRESTVAVQDAVETVRITGRVTKVEEISGELKITVDGWYIGNPSASTGTQITSTTVPGVDLFSKMNGRSFIVNPLNKVWGQHINVFMDNTAVTDPDGLTSGSFIEAGLINRTGHALFDDFEQMHHPLHFYGFDASIKGTPEVGDSFAGEDMNGGIAFNARSNNDRFWYQAFRNRAATVGFHNDATPENSDGTAFLTGHSSTGGAAKAFVARRSYSTIVDEHGNEIWDEIFVVDGDTPDISFGRNLLASQPRLTFKSSGFGNEFDVRLSALGGQNGVAGKGTLRVEAANIQLLGLPTSSAGLPANSVWRDGTTLKIV